jgi:hypothetical protein
MRANGLQINQPNTFIQRLAQQIQLSRTVKLKDTQRSKIAFLALPDFGVFPDIINRRIHINGGVVVQLFVLP